LHTFAASSLLAATCLLAAQVTQVSEPAILGHLNATISWYRHLHSVNQAAGQPSDMLYLMNARSEARQVLQLAFQAAQSAAALQTGERGTGGNQEPAETAGEQSPDQLNIAKALQNAADRLNQVQSQIADFDKRIEHSRGKQRQQLITRRDALQSEIELEKAVQSALQKISGYVSSSDNAQSGLAGRINAFKQSAPEILATTTNEPAKPATTGQSSKSSQAQASGLIGQAGYLFAQMRDIHEIDRLMAETNHVKDSAEQFHKPLRNTLRTLVQQGRDAANQAQESDPATVGKTRKDLEALTAQFKQVSNAALPLRQEMTLLDQVYGDLEEWRNSMLREYALVLRSLLTRVLAILLALSVVAVLSALWRRATLRYVHDARRKRQLLVLRRFVSGFLMLSVVLLGFLSEFSSLATFAGFLTAGIAVALQTVILSVAAYFTLIGRRGVKVGDRITVAGVTGDVLEIGLVRLHLMELGGTGIELYPTGRVVVFSNSVLFGATPLYKQLPGTSYTWHELAVTLSTDSDPALAQKMLTKAAESVYASYRDVIQHQHAVLERVLDTAVSLPEPTTKWQFSDAGLELALRYPVIIPRAEEIDDQMTRAVMQLLSTHPELKSVMSKSPKLRAPIAA